MSEKTCDQIVAAVVKACKTAGRSDIVALWGVPGTGKTHVARMAAKQLAGHDAFVKRVQFHQSFSYEDFIEGMRPNGKGGFEPVAGLFTDWNARALRDADNTYVLLIEELTRANVSAVLGELLTFIEYRNEPFELPVSRRSMSIADNLCIIATMNPKDRSALELDDAVVRRMRVISCPPSISQVREVLSGSVSSTTPDGASIISGCEDFMRRCRDFLGDRFNDAMPFGHGVFKGVKSWDDLAALWDEKLSPILFRPNMPHDEIADSIKEFYPRRPPAYSSQPEQRAEEP